MEWTILESLRFTEKSERRRDTDELQLEIGERVKGIPDLNQAELLSVMYDEMKKEDCPLENEELPGFLKASEFLAKLARAHKRPFAEVKN